MLNFGLIGCGKHAQWAVMPALGTARGCRFAAAADIAPANLALVTATGVAKYADYREMLKRERLDVAYVATPCEVHCDATCAALEAGCHVVCEKPMAMDEPECRRMIAAAERAKRLLVIDFENRYIGGHRQVREWIREGRLGTVRAVHIDSMWDGHKVTGPVSERRKGFLQRSGCLDCGVHKLDLARFYTGAGEWQEIEARGAWFGEQVRFAPHIAILGKLAPGILVTLNDSFAYTAYIPGRHHHESLAIVGEKGVIARDHAKDGTAVFHLESETLTTDCPVAEAGHSDVIPRLLEDVVDVIEGRRALVDTPLATGHDGLMAQLALDAANRSANAAGDVAGTAHGAKRMG